MADLQLYEGREATWVKHYVLQEYLARLAYKVGSWCSTLSYVDGFAGPWRAADEALSDTSPHIALAELSKASQGLARRGIHPTVRCLFIERDHEAVEKLRASLNNTGGIVTSVLEGTFESYVESMLQFARSGNRNFTFFFIDPTGWSGYGMQVIAPILQHEPGEVLINFMTKDIKRFVDDPESSALATFRDLFGSDDFRSDWKGLTGADREDAIVRSYCERVKACGNFKYVVSAVVLHPTDRRTHFHLIYGTRHITGLRVFREVEAKTMEFQEKVRAQAQQNLRVGRSAQPELFPPEAMGAGNVYQSMRARYLARTRDLVEDKLSKDIRVSFDDLDELTLTQPMSWTSDLKAWLRDWNLQGLVRYEGLAPRARVPQPEKNHLIIWLGAPIE